MIYKYLFFYINNMDGLVESIVEKYYNKGYRSPNKLFDKLKQKGYSFTKSDIQQ